MDSLAAFPHSQTQMALHNRGLAPPLDQMNVNFLFCICAKVCFPFLCPVFHVSSCAAHGLEEIGGTNSTQDPGQFEKART